MIHGTYSHSDLLHSITRHVFAKHLHHNMTTEDTLQHSKMERGVLNFLVVEAPGSWLLRSLRQGRTSRGGLSSDCTQSPIRPRTRLCPLQQPFLNIN